MKKLYRILAAATLIAVMANVAIPSGLAAVQYICNAEYMELSESSDFSECCTSTSSDPKTYHISDLKKEFCVTEQVCTQELTAVFLKKPVIIPAVPQLFATLTTSSPSFLSPLSDTFYSLDPGNVVPIAEPPIFLVNSVFLN